MRVGVIIERKNYYRLLGPVVDAALEREWEVVCFHDHAQSREGMKGYEFPSVDAVPRFLHGAPRVETYRGRDALPDAISTAGVDVVISITTPPDTKRPLAAKWITLQNSGELLSLLTRRILAADRIVLHSPWWLEFGFEFLRARGLSTPGDALEREIRRKSVVVGFPEFDQARMIDPEGVRRRFGIPSGKPVVVLLPYPFRSNPHTAWARWVYRPGDRMWRRIRLHLAGERHLTPLIARGWDDAAVARAVRAFCDANGAHLVVKSRLKDPVPRYLRRVADLTLYDESHYPATILEVVSVADLCVHFYSNAVIEAGGLGVRSLSICPALGDMGIPEGEAHISAQFSRKEGSLYQFRGVAETMGIGEAIERLPGMRLADFAVDPAARAAWMEKFLGFSDGKSAARLLDVAATLVKGSTAKALRHHP